jgi:hypothetical protein
VIILRFWWQVMVCMISKTCCFLYYYFFKIESCYVAWANFKFMIFPPQLPKCYLCFFFLLDIFVIILWFSFFYHLHYYPF